MLQIKQTLGFIHHMKYFSAIIIIFLFCSCNKTTNSSLEKEGIIQVGEHILTEQTLKEHLPEGINSKDSLILAESYIETWIKENLMYDLAQNNLSNEEEIDQLVENYRKSLITYQYQEKLINEKMSEEISEEEIKDYYEKHADKIKLETTLIKGLFLKVPADAPQINKIKEWYKSPSIKDLENIEKYSLQNAVNYDYFYDHWVKLDDIIRLFPPTWTNPTAMLKQQRQIEIEDSIFCYLLNVKEVLFAGEKEPYEYAKSNIKEMIVNQKRLEFLQKFENDLYKTAVNKGMVKRLKKQN